MTAQSGQPFTATIGIVDLNNDGNNRNERVPGVGRSTYHMPTTWSLDPRLTRDVKLNERAKLQFIAEAFNVFNRFNLTSSNATNAVRTALFAVSGGQLVRQSNFATVAGPTNPRIFQLGAKIVF